MMPTPFPEFWTELIHTYITKEYALEQIHRILKTDFRKGIINKEEYENLLTMVNSPDKENTYLALIIIDNKNKSKN